MVDLTSVLTYAADGVYALAIILFIVALHRMSNPATARSGILWAGAGMLVAIIVTGFNPDVLANGSALGTDLLLMLVALAIGGAIAYYAAIKVQMTAMPQMVAVYNGMGGGAAAAIAAVTMISGTAGQAYEALAITGGLIGAVSFAGSIIAFAKLQELINSKAVTFPAQNAVNMLVLAGAVVSGALALADPGVFAHVAGLSVIGPLGLFFILGLAFGFMMAIPIGGADMPVVISLFNAFTGMAVGLDGFATSNYAMIVAGVLVGAAGSILTLLMAKAMNRSISNVLFSAFGAKEETGTQVKGSLKPIEAADVAVMLAYASKVVVAPGYGMAVAQAQQKVKEMMDVLEQKGVQVKFAIHPVAGRMPGHMNVLLAEAGVPYDHLYDLEDINSEFETTDVAMVIGANDTVNPAAHRQGSPLFGMPILEVERAKNVIVLKRGQGKGFAGVENDLFFRDNTRMFYGDAADSISKLVQELKKL